MEQQLKGSLLILFNRVLNIHAMIQLECKLIYTSVCKFRFCFAEISFNLSVDVEQREENTQSHISISLSNWHIDMAWWR